MVAPPVRALRHGQCSTPDDAVSLMVGVDHEAVDTGSVALGVQPDGADRPAVAFDHEGVRVAVLGLR
jgi:hypothetical protein